MVEGIDPHEPRPNIGAIGLIAVLVAAFTSMIFVMLAIPMEPSRLSHTVSDTAQELDIGNVVNLVLLDFRALDTLMEKGVLILALVGVWALAREGDWQAPPANFITRHDVEPPLSVLLKVLAPLVIISAVYLIAVGADEPGGAFQAGTVLAALGLLLVLGRVIPTPRQDAAWLRWGIVAGVLLFIGVGLALLFGRESFLDYPDAWTKTLIVALEYVLTISIALTLFMLVSGLPETMKAAPSTGERVS